MIDSEVLRKACMDAASSIGRVADEIQMTAQQLRSNSALRSTLAHIQAAADAEQRAVEQRMRAEVKGPGER